MNKVPKILYKYRNIHERTISMLIKDQLYFAKPSEFNDPFDCRAQRNQVRNFREGIENVIRKEWVQRGLSEENAEAQCEVIRQHPDAARCSITTDVDDTEFRNYIDEGLGVVSLSSCNNSILMWSHYADFHRGFCIGFNTANFGFSDGTINKVMYVKHIDKNILVRFFSEESSSDEQSCEKFEQLQREQNILLKYRDWQYEKEWRIMGGNGIGTYSPQVICEIIFGLKCSDENKITIREALNNKAIKYFQATEGDDDFSINITPLNK